MKDEINCSSNGGGDAYLLDRGPTPKTISSSNIFFHCLTKKFRLDNLKAYKVSFYTMPKGRTIGIGAVKGL